jgi:hypothetical protein
MHEGTGILVGLVAAHDDRALADTLAADLPEVLGERFGDDATWRTEVCETEAADALAAPSELIESVRRRLLDRGWEMGIGLTALPLRIDRRPVATQASASHGVGLVSIPALGAVHRRDRLRDAAARTVEGLLGEADRDDGAARTARMRKRSAELASPIALEGARGPGTMRFTSAAARANLRLLFGMIRANRPTRVMGRLTRAATAALGTGAYAITSANMWLVAHQSSWPRLLGVALLAMLLVLVALVVKHGLWERARDPAARERVVLFNIVTVTTLGIGIATLYATLFAVMAVAAVVVIPPSSFARQVQHAATVGEFARLAWFVASVATVGGAFGSLLESDGAVRDAAYRPHAARDPS